MPNLCHNGSVLHSNADEGGGKRNISKEFQAFHQHHFPQLQIIPLELHLAPTFQTFHMYGNSHARLKGQGNLQRIIGAL